MPNVVLPYMGQVVQDALGSAALGLGHVSAGGIEEALHERQLGDEEQVEVELGEDAVLHGEQLAAVVGAVANVEEVVDGRQHDLLDLGGDEERRDASELQFGA